MAWSFRKKIKIAPGIHINLSKSGVSTSVGPKGAKVNIGPRGTSLYTNIPGTGVYYRGKISDADNANSKNAPKKSAIPNSSSQDKPWENEMYMRMYARHHQNKNTPPHKHKPLDGWIAYTGEGRVFYRCLLSWRRFLIWIGIIILSVCLIKGIINVDLEWWRLTLYASLIIGALLFLWYINGGKLKWDDERKRFFRILWLSFSAALVMTCNTLADMPEESNAKDGSIVETTDLTDEVSDNSTILLEEIESKSQDVNGEVDISPVSIEEGKKYSDLLTGCLVVLSLIVIVLILSYMGYNKIKTSAKDKKTKANDNLPRSSVIQPPELNERKPLRSGKEIMRDCITKAVEEQNNKQ